MYSIFVKMWGVLGRIRLDWAVKIISLIEIIWGIYNMIVLVLWLAGHLAATSDESLNKMQIDFCSDILFQMGALCSRSLIVCVLILLIMFSVYYIKISVDLNVATIVRWQLDFLLTWLWTANVILKVLCVNIVVLVSCIGLGSAHSIFWWIILIVYRLLTYVMVMAFKYEVTIELVGHLFKDTTETYWELEMLILSIWLKQLKLHFQLLKLKFDNLILNGRLKRNWLRRKWILLKLFIYFTVIIPYGQQIRIWFRRIANAFLVISLVLSIDRLAIN